MDDYTFRRTQSGDGHIRQTPDQDARTEPSTPLYSEHQHELASEILERELHASEEKFRALVENVPGAVYRCEIKPPWRVHHMSDGVTLVSGRPAKEFIQGAMHWADIVLQEDIDRVESAVQQGVDAGKPFEIDYRIVDVYGDIHWVHEKGRAIYNADGDPQYLDGVIVDNTQAKLAEQTLLKINDELEQRVQARTEELQAANRELEAFAYSIAHDIRTPIRAITSFSQILQEDAADRLRPDEQNQLERVVRAGKHLAQLIDAILELLRFSRTEIIHEPVNLSLMVREIIETLETVNPELPVRHRIERGLLVYGDARLLHLVLQNLLENAWKFCRAQASPEVEFGRVNNAGETVHYVRDNGVGFDMAHAEKLFSPFQRLHSAGEYPGTGIGLAAVERIINRHGGRVWAHSKPGEGATFYFTLP